MLSDFVWNCVKVSWGDCLQVSWGLLSGVVSGQHRVSFGVGFKLFRIHEGAVFGSISLRKSLMEVTAGTAVAWVIVISSESGWFFPSWNILACWGDKRMYAIDLRCIYIFLTIASHTEFQLSVQSLKLNQAGVGFGVKGTASNSQGGSLLLRHHSNRRSWWWRPCWCREEWPSRSSWRLSTPCSRTC